MTSLLNDSPEHVNELLLANAPLDGSLSHFSVPVPNSTKPGYSPVYRNKYNPNSLISLIHPSLQTLNDLLEFSLYNNPNVTGFGTRKKLADGSFGEYEFDNYSTIKSRKNNFGSGLLFILQNNQYITESDSHNKIRNYGATDESFIVCLFSGNRSEWAIADLACATFGITNTALYDTLGPEASQYILNVTESPVVVCAKDKIETLINLKEKHPTELANLISLVSMDSLDLTPGSKDSGLLELAKKHNITLYDFKQVERFGEINRVTPIKTTPDTPYTISFTSGTTGANPKGVLITNRNAVAGVTFCVAKFAYEEHPTAYSFLPLAHIYERMNLWHYLFRGFEICFPQSSSPLTLFDDLKYARPHVLSLVPRVYTKLEAAIKSQTINNTDKPLLKAVFTKAINKKLELQSKTEVDTGNHLVYDRVTALLRKRLGFDRLRSFSTGSAPISPETVKFIKASLNCGMGQGYGLTESFAGISFSNIYEANPGSCGAIAITTEMRLREIPEMNYYANDKEGPKGELLLRGPQIFERYYKNKEETEKAFDEDGWFKTGDVARIDPETGRLYIIDRVKNFFKLAQGEYVTPERIENNYLSRFPLAAQAYAHGDSLKTFLVGIIGVDPAGIERWIKVKFGKSFTNKDDIVKFLNQRETKKRYLMDMNETVADVFQGFEKLHNVYLDFEPLTVQSGVVTPTFKIKRAFASKYFKDTFEKLYEEGSIIKDNKL